MKAKKHLFIISMLFINLTVCGQQIGSGYSSAAIPNFNIEMLSGFYQGLNAVGQVGDVTNTWNHLLNLRHSSTTNNHQLQIASSYTENDRLFFRKFARGTTGVANPAPVWNEVATRGVNTFTGNQIINGFLGVGLNRIPQHKLEVEGDHLSSRFLLRANNGSNADANLMLWASEPGITYSGVGIGNNVHNFKNSVANISLLNTTRGGSYIRLLDNEMRFNVMSSSGVDTQAIAINGAGNIGIGTNDPKARLHIFGQINGAFNGLVIDNRKNYGSGTGISQTSRILLSLTENGLADPLQRIFGIIESGSLSESSSTDGRLSFYVREGGSVNEKLRINSNGNVGIGTTDPKNKLSVNGTIWAKEVKVSLTDAADWVFDTNYKLKPLADVEKYIYENKHLPEIPSAEEFRQKDMNVSEMSNKLLQKIEELTLYAIEQDKKATLLQQELDRLKTENENYKSLATRLSAIEKELKK